MARVPNFISISIGVYGSETACDRWPQANGAETLNEGHGEQGTPALPSPTPSSY